MNIVRKTLVLISHYSYENYEGSEKDCCLVTIADLNKINLESIDQKKLSLEQMEEISSGKEVIVEQKYEERQAYESYSFKMIEALSENDSLFVSREDLINAGNLAVDVTRAGITIFNDIPLATESKSSD